MTTPEDRELERLAAIARNVRDAAPIVEELRVAGFDVDGVSDLYNRKLDYRAAIPILTSWLPRIGNRDVKESIVRALSVKWAAQVAPLLVMEFARAEDDTGLGLRWAIGNALSVVASDQIADDMLRLATDRQYGRAREMVVVGLGKLRDPRAKEVLLDLLGDEEVAGHAVMAIGKLRVKAARPPLQRLLNHPKTWVRREAKKAIARIDAAGSRFRAD